ncbi:FecR domain-containing protein, partial [Pseudomonas aeruginosa]
PFVVRAGKGSITVTGTRFNVWKYQDNVVVTVTEGSVKVRSEGSGNDSSLTPSMQASYY